MKITLLGDSIRQIGYGTVVPQMLGDNYEGFQPDDNCRFSKYTLRALEDWENSIIGSDIIHWNNGLWDVKRLWDGVSVTSPTEYVENMCRIADFLLKKSKKVIFATTTPVTEAHPRIRNVDINYYNSLIIPMLKEKNIIINDLNALVSLNIDEYIRKDDNIHLTPKGIEATALQVINVIKNTENLL